MSSVPQLAPDEPLSPELVLVLSPELRAQALERLGPPVWPRPRLRVVEASPAPVVRAPVAPPAPAEPLRRSLGLTLVARVGQLGLIFVAVTLVTLAMSLVAHAVR
jgi:hypothetical protein